MENAFLRNYWNPSHPLFYRQNPRPSPVRHQRNPTPTPKIVTIPVHFVETENEIQTKTQLDTVAATKIQKVFRGFMVRKNVKKILHIESEVESIRWRILKKEVLDSIARDARERLRVNEMLMSLLLKLDSIRGFDLGIRDLRKSVIRKAIALQEVVDSIVVGVSDTSTHTSDRTSGCNQSSVNENREIELNADRSKEMMDSVKTLSANGQSEDLVMGRVGSEVVHDRVLEDPCKSRTEYTNNEINLGNQSSKTRISNASDLEERKEANRVESAHDDCHLENQVDDRDSDEDMGRSSDESVAARYGSENRSIENQEYGVKSDRSGSVDVFVDLDPHRVESPLNDHNLGNKLMGRDSDGEIDRGNDELAGDGCGLEKREIGEERKKEESEELRKLMKELCERNEEQIRMIGALSRRVEMLERAVSRSENLRRKKNKKSQRAEKFKCERKL